MGAPAAIDYDALAQQHGGTATIDYDALAAQHGGTAAPAADHSHVSAEISATPGGPTQWLKELEGDIRYGSGNTVVGRALKSMGAQGVNVGAQASAGDTVASLPLGAVRAAQGLTEAHEHPMQGVKDIAGGALQAATIPGSFVAPEAAEAASAIPGKLAGMLPSAERAGQNFKEVMGAAKDVPVQLPNAQDAILKMVDWQKKTQLGPTVNKFLNRVTNPKLGDLTYEEARDFYQLLGRMSADESMKMAPAVRFDLTRMVQGLKTDVGNAAQTVGKGQQYYAAMKEFASAKKMEDISDATKQVIVNALKYGIGPGLAGYFAKQGIDAATQK